MVFVVPVDMSLEVEKEFKQYISALKAGNELPSFNLITLKEKYTKLLTMRFRKHLKLTTARRAARTAMDDFFESLMLTVQ